MGLMVMARCPDASSTLPCRGEGRTAEGSPGWGDGVTTYAENVEALSPPPGPLARADLPPPGGGEEAAPCPSRFDRIQEPYPRSPSVITTFPHGSITAWSPGGTNVVEFGSSITAGPSISVPA